MKIIIFVASFAVSFVLATIPKPEDSLSQLLPPVSNDDEFFRKFAKRVDSREMASDALNKNAFKELQHFQFLKSVTEMGEYAEEIMTYVKKTIDDALIERNYKNPITVEKFEDEVYKFENNLPSDEPALADAVRDIMKEKEEFLKEMAEEQAKAQLEAEQIVAVKGEED